MRFRWRRGTRVAVPLVVAMAFFLSGCITFSADLTVDQQDQVSGSIIVAYPQEVVGLVSGEPELSGWQKRYEFLPGATVRGFDQDGRVGNEVVLREVAIADFSQAGEGPAPIRISRVDDELRISGELDFSRFDGNQEADEGVVTANFSLFSTPDMRVSITVPGDILSTNGTVDDDTNTITWRLRVGQNNTLSAIVYAPLPSPSIVDAGGVWLVAGIGVVAGLGIGVALVLVARRRQGGPGFG